MRYPYAAKQLLREIEEIDPTVRVEAGATLDGLGVIRTLRFDPVTADWLCPALQACDDDRIASLAHDENGLKVTFVGDRHADDRYPFLLAEAHGVLTDDDDAADDHDDLPAEPADPGVGDDEDGQ
jgi:hypothetical protein